jgi:hypothetical protein
MTWRKRRFRSYQAVQFPRLSNGCEAEMASFDSETGRHPPRAVLSVRAYAAGPSGPTSTLPNPIRAAISPQESRCATATLSDQENRRGFNRPQDACLRGRGGWSRRVHDVCSIVCLTRLLLDELLFEQLICFVDQLLDSRSVVGSEGRGARVARTMAKTRPANAAAIATKTNARLMSRGVDGVPCSDAG